MYEVTNKLINQNIVCRKSVSVIITLLGGGAEEASRKRVRCAWGKFNELAPL